jgi:superfamily II DNA/RNA helicase
MSNKSSFLLLNNSIQEKLAALNITNPTAVQNEIIPQILDGKDILFQSETGTGKTFAYLLPLINKIEENDDIQSAKVIVIAPTIELASQINSACKTVSSRKSALLVGGAPLKRQIEILKEKPQIIIGTAARLNELIRLKKLKVDKIIAIVFDETDRLVKKELYDDTAELKNLMPQNCQIIACSATLNNPTKKFFYGIDSVTLEPENILKDRITHWAIYAETRDKIDTLRKFLLAEKPTKALIFTSRADQVENIYNKLTYKKIECVCLHAKTDKQKQILTNVMDKILEDGKMIVCVENPESQDQISYKTIEKETGNVQDKELIWDNHSLVMFDHNLIPDEQIKVVNN